MQEIVQTHGCDYFLGRRWLPIEQLHALLDIATCQTGALGTHLLSCECCGYLEQRPNSCRNRHCPTCGGRRRAKWLAKIESQLLPTSYMQVVFTLPHELIPLIQRYPCELYDLLFHTAWETLQTLAADPKHLGAQLGAMAVLHTWNQKLQSHPHVHFVLPAGGLSLDGESWVPCRRRKGKGGKPGGYYLFPHQVIALLFRGKFLAGLKALVTSGKIPLSGLPPSWNTAAKFKARCDALYTVKWVVNQEAPPPDCEPTALVKYLARYVAGMAINDSRLVSLTDSHVTFTAKNRKAGGNELITLPVAEFLSRYLQHVLPARMARVRYYGLWHPRCVAQRERAKELCADSGAVPSELQPPTDPAPTVSIPGPSCPQCKTGTLDVIGIARIWGWSGRRQLLLGGPRLRRWSGPRVLSRGHGRSPSESEESGPTGSSGSSTPPAGTGPPARPPTSLSPAAEVVGRVRAAALELF